MGEHPPPPDRAGTRRFVLLAGLAAVAAVGVHYYSLVHATLFWDDFQHLIRSWTWARTQATLWEPANEHAMPLGRLTTWVLVHVAGRATAMPLAAALQGPLAVLLALGLLYPFVRGELGHPFYGLLAAILFGVSSAYDEAVTWFSASFSVLTLDTLLLMLLAAQRWRQTGRAGWLILSALFAALAPAWFASGVLAGPLGALYLWPREEGSAGTGKGWKRGGAWSRLLNLAPLAGTALFLAVSLPLTARQILHLEHYYGKTALQAIQPKVGLVYTARSLVDNLIPGALGVSDVVSPPWLVGIGLVVLAAVGLWWWRGAPRRRLLLLGLGCILASYLLVYSARAEWEYERMSIWTRYHLLPHLGLVLFLCGGLPRWQGRFGLQPSGALSRRQALVLAGLVVLLFASQVPRGVLLNLWRRDLRPQQMAFLERIDEVDARCREDQIPGETARRVLKDELGRSPELLAVLDAAPEAGFPADLPWPGLAATTEERLPGWLQIPGCTPAENGWDFVRGSDRPRPGLTTAEARRLLPR